MTIRLVRSAQAVPRSELQATAALGNFDGVHTGHCRILSRLREVKSSQPGPAVVIGFDPHPALVLGRLERVPLITSLRQKLQLLEKFEVDYLLLLEFTTELAQVRAADFVAGVLVGSLNVGRLLVGPDAAIGRGREGRVPLIRSCLEQAGRTVEVVPLFELEGGRVSSGRIRHLISTARFAEAELLLGRPYRFDGRVVSGDRRGAALGFPTANLMESDQVLPGRGVFATRTQLQGQSFDSVTNVGVRPTFEGDQRLTVETHLLDYSGPEFYGADIEVEFVDKLRDEQKFAGVAELQEQIRVDAAAARGVLDGD